MRHTTFLATIWILTLQSLIFSASIKEALFTAIERGNTSKVKRLLSKPEGRAAANARRGHSGATPSHWAARCGRTDMLQYLVACGATTRAQDNKGMTPLHVASERGHGDVVSYLLKQHQTNINAQDNSKQTPLHWAARGGHITLVETLVNAGACLDAVHTHGYTPLHLATLGGHEAVVKILLDAGAQTSGTPAPATTPLHIAASTGKPAIARLLLKAGAYTDDVDRRGNTPLVNAIGLLQREKNGLFEEVACVLIDHGADVSQKMFNALQHKPQHKAFLAELKTEHIAYQEAITHFRTFIVDHCQLPNFIADLILGSSSKTTNVSSMLR